MKYYEIQMDLEKETSFFFSFELEGVPSSLGFPSLTTSCLSFPPVQHQHEGRRFGEEKWFHVRKI